MTPRHLIPWSLILLRLILGPAILLAAAHNTPGAWLVVALTAGVLSDIFDGIIARRLGTATARLRQADSAADVVFWLCILAAAQLRGAALFPRHAIIIAALLLAGATNQATSLLRFQKPVATHTYFAKSWGLVLFVGAASMFIAPTGFAVTFTCLYGIAVECEIFAILRLAKSPPIDVKSIFHLR